MKIVICFSFKWKWWHRRVYDFTILSFESTFKVENFNGENLKEYLWKELMNNANYTTVANYNKELFRIISISRL